MAGDIKLSSNFELNSQRALDSRINVPSIPDRDNIPTIQRYDRMIVSIEGGETYQLKLGLIDTNLANNTNWALFGHAQNTDVRILNQGSWVIAYNFGASTPISLQVKKISLNFAGQNKYIGVLYAWNVSTANQIIEIYEDGILIHTQEIVYQLDPNSYFGASLNKDIKLKIGKNYKLTFRKEDNTSFWVYAMNPSTFYEEGIPYPPETFTVDYTQPDDNEVIGYTRSPIARIKGHSWFSKVETLNENVLIDATELQLTGNLSIKGDIIQEGAAYETHAEQLFTEKDLIIMREKAIAALAAGAFSGFKIIKYDGSNNLIFAVDLNGVARLGDESGTKQAIATREDTPTDQGFAKWDAATEKFITQLLDLSGFLDTSANAQIKAGNLTAAQLQVNAATNPIVRICNAAGALKGAVYYDTAGAYVMLYNNARDGGLRLYDDDGRGVFSGHLSWTMASNEYYANITINLSHNRKMVQLSAAVTVTLPNGINAGFFCEFMNIGTGTVTFVAEGGALKIHALNNKYKLIGQYSCCSVYNRGDNNWVLYGDLST